jgi:cell filamentation protein, protein adenylyltransferase
MILSSLESIIGWRRGAVERDAFAPGQRRYVVRAEGGYLAFVPPPLPPDVTFNHNLIATLSAADRAIGELAGVGRTLPNPEILTAPIVRREAVLSSRIEGTRASVDQLALFELDPPAGANGDVREVYNYLAALNRVLAPDRRLPLSLPLLLEAHETLLTGVRGGYATPGEFRRSPNWIGPPGSVINDATYVPPPPEFLWDCLGPFEKYLHAEHALPPLMVIGCLHYQFEAIHPFLDGNGRVGRLMIVLLLIEWNLLPAPLLDLSAYIEPRRDEYYSRLLAVSTQGDWTGWLLFFLRAVAEQATDAVGRAQALQRLRESYRARVTTARASSLLPQLVDALFKMPALTIGRAQQMLGVSRRAATVTVEKLVAAGVLVEARTGARRYFLAREIIGVANGETDAIMER